MQISAEKIWNSAQEHLRVKLSRDTFNMWFAPLRACVVDANQITIEAPNEFCEVWLKDNYLGLLQLAVRLGQAGAKGCNIINDETALVHRRKKFGFVSGCLVIVGSISDSMGSLNSRRFMSLSGFSSRRSLMVVVSGL